MDLNAQPVPKTNNVVRNRGTARLFDSVLLNDVLTTYNSPSIQTIPYRKFALFLRVKSSGTPTTVRFKIQFLDEVTGRWHDYLMDPFTALYYEDTDTATEVDEMFIGDCAGRAMRVVAVGSGTTSSNTFTVSASIELWD